MGDGNFVGNITGGILRVFPPVTFSGKRVCRDNDCLLSTSLFSFFSERLVDRNDVRVMTHVVSTVAILAQGTIHGANATRRPFFVLSRFGESQRLYPEPRATISRTEGKN